MRIAGTVTDFCGNPLLGAHVRIDGRDFEREVASTDTDELGRYTIDVPAGNYLDLWIARNCGTESLEYWAWNVIIDSDITVDARVGAIELYGMNAFWIQLGRAHQMMLYFRPMALSKCLAFEAAGRPDHGLIDICPALSPDSITATLDGSPLAVLELTRVVERPKQGSYHLYGYLAQVQAAEHPIQDHVRKLHVAVRDTATAEQGEGSLFWRPPQYEPGREPGTGR